MRATEGLDGTREMMAEQWTLRAAAVEVGPNVARIPSKSACETLVIPTKAVLSMTTKISAHWDLKTCREFIRDE